MRRFLVAAVAFVAIVAFFCPSARPHALARDYNAFYCAGQAVAQHADPYRAQPLQSCESARKNWGYYTVPNGVALPAPLPPYDLAVFSALSHAPYEIAATLWIVLILVSLVATIEAMHRLTQIPRWALALVFAPIDGWMAIFLGEVTPIAVASLALAMLALREGHPRLAAAVLALSLCEPHVGIAPMLALFLCVPRTRPTIALSTLFLVALSFVAVGTATSFEYVRDVLPAHAVSEIESTRQLSLTALLHLFGVGDRAALTLGSLSYLAMLLVGVYAARRLAARDQDDPLIVAVPAAFVLLGGVFIHMVQMPAALPAALVAYTRTDGRLKALLGAAIIVLATPWLSFLGIIVPIVGVIAGALSFRLLGVRPRTAIAIGIAAAAYTYGLQIGLATGQPYPSNALLPPIAPHDLAEVNWGENVRSLSTVDHGVFELARLPLWLAIAAVVVAIGIAVRSAEPQPARAIIALRIRTSSQDS